MGRRTVTRGPALRPLAWRVRVGLLFAAFILAGCAYQQPYPEHWAAVAQGVPLCASISGDYTPFDYESRLAISWIAGNPNPKPPAKVLPADRLALRLSGATLTATAFLDGVAITEKQYPVQCGADSIVLDLGKGLQAGQGVVGYESTRMVLRRDVSGALVVNQHSSGVGAYGPIPFAGSSSAWVGRLLPYDPKAVIPQEPRGPAPPCEYELYQIRTSTRQQADEVEAALDRGESFEQLASTHNRWALRVGKGRLGWVHADWFPKLAPTIVGLRPGEVSRAPVQDEAGWHILKVTGVRPEGCVAPALPTPTPAP